MDQDSHWGTFPVGFLPFFAFSLPNTSRKADLGPALLLALPFSPWQGSWTARPDTVTRPGSSARLQKLSGALFCFALPPS